MRYGSKLQRSHGVLVYKRSIVGVDMIVLGFITSSFMQFRSGSKNKIPCECLSIG